jgi:hypothetical protein
LALSVRVEDALPPAETVTGLGRSTETPDGAAPFHVGVRLTVEPRPPSEASWIVADCDKPGLSHITVGEGGLTVDVIAKSGATGARTEDVP